MSTSRLRAAAATFVDAMQGEFQTEDLGPARDDDYLQVTLNLRAQVLRSVLVRYAEPGPGGRRVFHHVTIDTRGRVPRLRRRRYTIEDR